MVVYTLVGKLPDFISDLAESEELQTKQPADSLNRLLVNKAAKTTARLLH